MRKWIGEVVSWICRQAISLVREAWDYLAINLGEISLWYLGLAFFLKWAVALLLIPNDQLASGVGPFVGLVFGGSLVSTWYVRVIALSFDVLVVIALKLRWNSWALALVYIAFNVYFGLQGPFGSDQELAKLFGRLAASAQLADFLVKLLHVPYIRAFLDLLEILDWPILFFTVGVYAAMLLGMRYREIDRRGRLDKRAS